MNRTLLLGAVLLALLLPVAGVAQKASGIPVDIPYSKFVLDNGLTLLVHEDHKAPIVAVNVWYHVGSKNEKPGRTGFAHLFEHLMFNGSENFNDDYFQVLERVGATNLNGTTNSDRTNYFQNVPTSAFELALWMESDRMGHLLGAIDQKKLDEQRGVVQNEKRQGENEPYAVADELITKSTWPAGHPYSWTVIGSMEDLGAASLNDVHEWFKTYYGAANAVLVVAGDIDPQTAFEKVKKYFSDVPSGPPVAHHEAWIAKRTGTQRQIVEDRVPQARIFKIWNVPYFGTTETNYLSLLSSVLASGKTSRLYKRLVYDEQVASSVSSYVDVSEIAGQFYVDVTAKPGGDLKRIEQVIDEELASLLKNGPTERELQRVKSEYRARFIRGAERIGGFGGKSDILAQNLVYAGDADQYKKTYATMVGATSKDIQRTAQEWLSDGAYILEVLPFGQFKSSPTDTLVRKTMPKPAEPPVASFPKIERATLSNGLKIALAERHSIPVVNLSLLFDAGYAADQFGLPGTANLAMNMLDEGTKTRDALQLSEELSMLGANLNTGSGLDLSSVTLNALKANLEPSLALMADVLLNPSFPADELARQQKQTVAGIQREKSQPMSMGLRVLPKFLFGEGHAYANPLTGSGTEESVKKLTREAMVQFHQTWLKPNNATMVIVGDITMDEIKPKLEKLFAAWKPADVPKKNIGTVPGPSQSVVYLIDKPGAQQSVVLAGQLAPLKSAADDIALEAMNTILGGSFTSRINMNIREQKHWSYGARTMIAGARGQRPYLAYAPVQSDKTMETMVEIRKELSEITAARPATQDELLKIQNSLTLALPGSWETISAVGGSINTIVNYGLADDYYNTYPQKIRALTTSNVTDVAKSVLKPGSLVWVIIGDRKTVEGKIRELGYGEIRLIDSDGNAVK